MPYIYPRELKLRVKQSKFTNQEKNNETKPYFYPSDLKNRIQNVNINKK